jgi:3-keto-L-gulonate-6-phosphate decarboxylase
MSHHGSVVDPTNIHKFWNWVQATDPATTDPTLIADNQSWLDTTGTPYALKVRISGAWVTVGSTGGLTQEQIEDFLGNTTLVAGTNMTVTYNDGAGTITLASSGGLTQEQIEDFLGTSTLVAGTNMTVTYNDVSGHNHLCGNGRSYPRAN